MSVLLQQPILNPRIVTVLALLPDAALSFRRYIFVKHAAAKSIMVIHMMKLYPRVFALHVWMNAIPITTSSISVWGHVFVIATNIVVNYMWSLSMWPIDWDSQ